MRKLILVAIGISVAAVPVTAAARVATNTVEPTAELSKNGLRAEVGVLLSCDRSQRVRVRVTLTQEGDEAGRGAVGQGRRRVDCTTEKRRFAVQATARANRRLGPGKATACVLAVTGDDVRQWCKNVTLE